MSSKTFYRIGGIAALLSVLLALIDIFITVDVNGRGTRFDYYSYLLDIVLIVLVVWALYRLYNSVDRRLSLVAVISSTIGGVVLFINATPFVDFPDGVFLTALIFNQIVPILLFGILAYQNPQLGIPRVLAAIGILYIFFYLILYQVFSNTDLGVLDNLPLILNLVWLAWTGAILLFGKLQEVPEKINAN
jgi:hypothetical protein